MTKKILLLLVAGTAFAARASTITFQPASQTINLGASTTVDVNLGGLSANQAIGAFDFLVLNNSSIIVPTSVTFFSDLGDPTLELTGSTLANASAEAAETSFESTATLLALQANQPFSLFQVTYTAVGLGTSSLTLGSSPEILADGSGKILTDPTVTAGSITVVNGGISPVPEPSSFALLGSGACILIGAVKRRRAV
jgi:hypothetical protein